MSDRIALMDMFREDMKEIDPEGSQRQTFKSFDRDPETFQYVHAEFLFKIWSAGRASHAEGGKV
ncbi:hypothetical protein [Bowmanella yangjiangensis]|uniref:Uncharacterized protein n=1 Tax=Bowmanella yangjiangensis TaxID=2811230 RepID=A0ABS3D0Y2_9ALTE|nr:hypothetical protein [Bowmanella yangjiangensis]MBN7822450.1 hypothetical protein [Bowmanella yangjiangensis]